VHLTGHIAVERPRNFRLTAGALGMTEEADFGSNTDWFWLWVRRSNPPYVYRARHDDMEHSDALRQMIPFQPDWLIEALGVVPIDPKQITRMEPGETHQTVNLISELLSPSGQPVQKVIRVDLRHSVVLGHYLYDANRRLIAKADLANHAVVGGVIMPHLVTLEWPQAGMQINLELGQIEVNPTTIPHAIWEVPNKGPTYAGFDIGARSRAPMRRNNSQPTGRVRLGADGAESAKNENAAAFDDQFGKSDEAPRSTVGRSSSEGDNGQEWNQPLESADDALDSRTSRPPAHVLSPNAADTLPQTSSRPTPPAGPTPRDPFASEPAWSNSQPAQSAPTAPNELIEAAPR
jgi:hypothetical protein